MRARKFLWGRAAAWLCALAAAAGCAGRIAAVNRAGWLEKYAADTVLYGVGSTVELPSEYYYFSGYAALEGYYMYIAGTELVPTEKLLSEYGMTLSDLEAPSGGGRENDLADYGYVYIVTAVFGNRDYANNADAYITLDNFLLVGTDYFVNAATDTINSIPLFNEELGGASAFGISSGREMTFRIAYLIDTCSESALSVDYLLSSPPRLLIGCYPEEIYIELPRPVLK